MAALTCDRTGDRENLLHLTSLHASLSFTVKMEERRGFWLQVLLLLLLLTRVGTRWRSTTGPRSRAMLSRSSGRFFGPALCFSTSEKCRLTCEGNTREAEPVSYSWGGATKHLSVTKKNSSHVLTFSCRMENPVGEKVSRPLTNLCFTCGPLSGPTC